MDDLEMDEAEGFGLGALPSEEEGEETASITAAANSGALPYGDDVRAEYESARKAYETSTQDVLNQIQKARDLLLSQKTEKSKSEMLRGLAMSLAAPRDRNDPRFYERKNLYTFLRDVGEYGTAQAEAQKKAELMQKEQMLKLDELAAKYGQQSALERLKAVGPLYREMMKPKKEEELPADVKSLRYYRNVIKDPNASAEEKSDAQAMIKKLTREPTEKPPRQTWNERIVEAKLRKKQGKATPEDEIIIEMSEKSGSDFLSILSALSGKAPE